MISGVWFSCWMFLLYYSVNINARLVTYILVGEAGFLSCETHSFQQSNCTMTWFRNGSDVPIATGNSSRIHQQRKLLWFIPANMEDSGFYKCVCDTEESEKELKVFKNSDNLCFNREIVYLQHLPTTSNGKLVCPDLMHFVDQNTELVLQWNKDCSPGLFENRRFVSVSEYLLINNLTKADEGTYVCQATYTYMGKQYNVSRAIHLTPFDSPPKFRPQILYPRNNSIEVELGFSVVIECNVSTDSNEVLVYWEGAGNHSDYFEDTYEQESYMDLSPSGKSIRGTKFNISQVQTKDYFKYLCCVQSPTFGKTVAYLVLKRPSKSILHLLLGGFFVALFVILAAVVIYKFFKVDIVLWYRVFFYPLLNKEVSDGKLYDAYVLYPKNVANCMYSTDIFVMKVLPEVLEKQCGYTLFILGRDDLPGQAVISTVDEVIRQSRRVIVVLVPDSFSSSMQTEDSEQQVTMYSALIEEGIKVILVELDKIKDDTNMPESIKYLKQKHGVLLWRGDFSEESQLATTKFWKNVRYKMPVNRSSSSSNHHSLPVIFNSSRISKR